jgi:fructokinase
MLKFGVDLGGTKTEIIALDEGGATLLRRRVATPAHDYVAIVSSIAGLVSSAERELGARATVGVGTPGALSRASGLMKNSNTDCLIGKPLKQDLERALAREIRMENDANCFALCEALEGAGAQAEVVFGVILGTGVGGGIVVSRRLLGGANDIAGEWGHNPLPLPGSADLPLPVCYCGRRGCIETFLSGPGFARDHLANTGQELAPRDIVAAAEAGDPQATRSLSRYEERLARSLALVVNILDPDVVVLGGGMSNIERLYENVPKLWRDRVFSDRVLTRLERPRHGDSSGVRGAAWLWE